jgi:hypothetical protein
MTIADIITRTREIVQQRTAANSTVTDSSILAWANECTLALCSIISTLPKESITGITAASTITFARNVLRLDYAAIQDGTTYHPLSTIDFNNFVKANPNWQNQSTSKPAVLVRLTDLNWMMWPSPDATWTGKTLSLYGAVQPDDITSTSDEPPVSRTLHHAYPHYCAWLFFLALNNPERAAAEYATFDGIRRLNTKTATSTNGSLQSFRV